jgi:hypothetical protein
MQSITEYEAQEADLRGELRRLRLELREGIQAEKLRLTLAVVWLIPLLALVLGIISHLLRGRARRA